LPLIKFVYITNKKHNTHNNAIASEPNMTQTTPRYVIHKHQATHLHWDFRLEMDNVLKSWAIPKEPPSQPNIKRLAVEVEDHQLSYIDFQGTIPEGQYGAGTVEIWDKGTYTLRNRTQKIIEFTLHGERLTGDYVLIRFKQDKNWLLFKKKTKIAKNTPDKH
jgi:DNA ligase D-like protein (predicted 3'-phosphoesterase)